MSFADVPTHSATQAELDSIVDVVDRMIRAAQIARPARAETFKLRDPRNVALVVLLRRRGYTKTACWKLVGINRRTFEDALERLDEDYPDLIPDPDEVDWDGVNHDEVIRLYRHLLDLTTEEVSAIAESKGKRYDTQMSIWITAARVRDDIARDLMNGKHGPPWSNARVARATGLTTPAVAGIRTGDKNPKPAGGKDARSKVA